MFTVELYAKIRHAVMVDGLSRREAAKRFGVHRNTITKMLSFSVPPGYRRRERPASKKLGPYMAWIDAILEGDRRVHKKQQHTAHRIFERLRDEQVLRAATRSCVSMWRRRCYGVHELMEARDERRLRALQKHRNTGKLP